MRRTCAKTLRLSSRYDHLCDQAVVKLAQAGDRRAIEHLLYKYRSLVRSKARSYYLTGAEREDILQVGMIGLWQSITDYSPQKDVTFLSFARICVERHIITAIKAATRRKQSPLNNAISLEFCAQQGGEFDLSEIIVSDMELDPEEILLQREDSTRLSSTLKALLSGFEWEVLKRYHMGKSYLEIANELACNTKSIDNALGRIKRKVTGMPGALVA